MSIMLQLSGALRLDQALICIFHMLSQHLQKFIMISSYLSDYSIVPHSLYPIYTMKVGLFPTCHWSSKG